MILFGHPTGNPNSHHAALAHFETGRLAAFCVPWMPSEPALELLGFLPPLRALAERLKRRHFAPLVRAPKIQGRLGEFRRLALRARGHETEGLAYEANDWLMRTMARACIRKEVSAVHAYEDCSLSQFLAAKRLGKPCLYDMPIGYYPAWAATQAKLSREFPDWLPAGGLPSNRWVRPEQKQREMELADLVLAPSSFVRDSILQFHPEKKVVLAPYGVDLEFWHPLAAGSTTANPPPSGQPLRFIFAGQCSLRKGTPVLLEAWARAAIPDAHLELVGSWQMAPARLKELPANVSYTAPVARRQLRDHYRAADVFLFPSYFEGFALVVLEAMACGLPIVATEATPDILDESCTRIIPSGNVEALVETLRWFDRNRHRLPGMKQAARAKAETCTWANYRRCVSEAVRPFV